MSFWSESEILAVFTFHSVPWCCVLVRALSCFCAQRTYREKKSLDVHIYSLWLTDSTLYFHRFVCIPLSCFFVYFSLWSCFDFYRCKNALPITHAHAHTEQWHRTLQHRNQFMCIAWCRMNMMQIKGELTTGNYCWISHFELMLIARK